MKRLLEISHRMDDHACMWSGVEDLTGKQEQTDKASGAFSQVLDAMSAGFAALSV